MDTSNEHRTPDPVALARDIATRAHEGQTDKSGEPYIGHPERVAARVHSPEEKIVAWLHDVVEDTEVTADDLRHSFSDEIVDAVIAISKLPQERRLDYYERVKANPLALTVKLADVADNQSPARMARLDHHTRERLTRNYEEAIRVLSDATDDVVD